jgi:6-phosphofructokinase 1
MSIQGNALVAQSGGPTAVINASACGVIQEAMKTDCITGVFAAHNGVLGVLDEDIFDLSREDPEQIDGLKRSPSSALGSCRYKLKSLHQSRADYERILDVFRAHDIHYFFYIGGNDSMDTAHKLSLLAREESFPLIVMGVPKTVDNDLAGTDHTPGYGSVAKYNATIAMEAGRDTEALCTHDTACVMEVMGRNAGWIAAAMGVAHRSPEDAPHLIYLPEIPFSMKQFVRDCRKVHSELGRVFIVVGEGINDGHGSYVAEQKGAFAKDSFGHTQLGGVAETLKRVVESEVGIKSRYIKHGIAQRNGIHFASRTDRDEAYVVGQRAVQHAAEGTSGLMVTLERTSSDPYVCETGLASLEDVANGEKMVPRAFINEEGNGVTQAMLDYVTPLMQGEVEVTIAADGLPEYTRFERHNLEKRCTKREE